MTYSEVKKKAAFKGKSDPEHWALISHHLQNQGNGISYLYKDAVDELISQHYPELGPVLNDKQVSIQFDVPFPPTENPDFTFIDLFAGIGGFRLAFQSIGGKCVFSSEWNDWARKTYEANFGEVPFGDITKIPEEQIPDHDILLGGFPCQPFSLAGVSKKNSLGKNHGFLDETQGTLFFDIARILQAKKPRFLLLENVKNLKSHDKGKTFLIIQETLRDLGYEIFTKVIDARNYVPQHRERVFIFGYLKEKVGHEVPFHFPKAPTLNPVLGEILEDEVDAKYILTDNLWAYLKSYAEKHRKAGNGFGFGLTDQLGVARTLSARYHKDGSEILISRGDGEIPRRLTPKECKRLMGYPEQFKIDGIGVSDTQLYRQFGNSVAVPVVVDIANSIKPHLT
jgi:DNA (cytosine-5)-methyltransferase 1